MCIKTLVAFIMVFSFHSYGQQYDNSLIPYRKGKLWGYCDPDKKIIIEPRYTEAQLFEGLLAKVKVDSHYCIINRQGKVLSSESVFWPAIINEGMNYTVLGYGGYMIYNDNGKSLTKLYAEIKPFNKYGYAEILDRGFSGIGLIDRNYNEVIAPKYSSIQFLSDKLLAVQGPNSQKWHLYNLKSNIEIEGEYMDLLPEREGLIMARRDSLFGFIDGKGRLIIPFKYLNSVPLDYEPISIYDEKTNIGYNVTGFYCGRAVVVYANKTGYLDKQGRVAIPFEFDKGFGFTENRAWVKKNGKWGMIDTNGRFIIDPVYSTPESRLYNESLLLAGYHEGMVMVEKKHKIGYANQEGDLIIPCKYSNGESFFHGLAGVSKKGRVFFINKSGEEEIPPVAYFTDMSEFENTFRLISYDVAYGSQEQCVWYLLDSSGNRQIVHNITCGYDQKGFKGNYAVIRIGDTTSCIINRQSQIVYQSVNNLRLATGDLIFDYELNCYIDFKRKIKYCEQ